MSIRVLNVQQFCAAIDDWASRKLSSLEGSPAEHAEFQSAWTLVRNLGIGKSCLLDRVLYCGEKPSKTPCPVHNGWWRGIHMFGSRLMPDGLWHLVWRGAGGERIGDAETEWHRRQRDAGCRCFMHGCGCTTGWQPDEHCGCGVKP